MKDQKNRTQIRNLVFSPMFLVGVAVAVGGCASMERSVMLGVGVGAGAGTAMGIAVGGRDKTEAALISAGVGAVVGGVASYIIHGALDKRDNATRRDTLFNLESHGIKGASFSSKSDLSDVGGLITMPEVEEEWVDTHTDGNRLVEGHRQWRLLSGAHWDLSRKPEPKRRKK